MTPKQAKQNSDIGDLITKISLKLSDSSETILIRENKKMDNLDHQQCLRMGYDTENEDQAKIDDYFACRKALIEERKLLPPFGNTDYLKYQNHSYNLGFVIDQRISEMLKRYNEAKEKYPDCIKYNLLAVNFKNCTMAQDNSRQCLGEIDRKRFKKDGEEKILCQKQAYIQFNDDMLKEEDRPQRDISRMNNNSDFYNRQSLASIGVDGAIFSSEQKKSAEQLKKEKEEKIKRINSKSGLYNKSELTKLRQKFIFSCQRDAEVRIKEFADNLKKSCEELTKFEVIGEE